jgi:tetratricopeptide (TPR) repeat protein
MACQGPVVKTSGDPSGSPPAAQGLKRDRPESELDRSLLSLGEKSLAEGRPKEAASRFQRVLKRSPDSASARRGMARAELAQGNLDAAREWLGPASLAVGNTALLRTWAEIYRREGDSEAERGALEKIVAVNPARYTAHQRLADLTGPAPPSVSGSVDARLLRARQHPYDAKALLGGARAALSQGDEKTAGRWLTRLVWLADVDPDASRAAIQELSEIDPAWKDRIVVPVHIYADQSVRAEPGWRARMRLVWRSLSVALDPLLQLLFIPVSISEFDSSGSSSTLAGIEQAFRRTAGVLPSSGMIAAFTDRQPPEGGGMWRLGVAEFLGRVMVMRLAPGEISSRTLAHEAMHIFGAVHVSDERGSLMNPSGNSLNIDPSNIEITRLLRTRRFRPGGLDANVIPYVDVPKLSRAYVGALSRNLKARSRGLKEANRSRGESRYIASQLGQDATSMDTNLGDVSAFTAVLMLRQGRHEDAIALFSAAGRLYGPNTPRGQEMMLRAGSLRDREN